MVQGLVNFSLTLFLFITLIHHKIRYNGTHVCLTCSFTAKFFYVILFVGSLYDLKFCS